jgi:hypothetical protein
MRENKDPTKKLTGFVRRTKRNIHGEINYGFGQKIMFTRILFNFTFSTPAKPKGKLHRGGFRLLYPQSPGEQNPALYEPFRRCIRKLFQAHNEPHRLHVEH